MIACLSCKFGLCSDILSILSVNPDCVPIFSLYCLSIRICFSFHPSLLSAICNVILCLFGQYELRFSVHPFILSVNLNYDSMFIPFFWPTLECDFLFTPVIFRSIWIAILCLFLFSGQTRMWFSVYPCLFTPLYFQVNLNFDSVLIPFFSGQPRMWFSVYPFLITPLYFLVNLNCDSLFIPFSGQSGMWFSFYPRYFQVNLNFDFVFIPFSGQRRMWFSVYLTLFSDSSMTSFFRFVDKRAIHRWYNLLRTCAGECDWLFHW